MQRTIDFKLTGTPWNGQDPNSEQTPWGNLIKTLRGGVLIAQNTVLPQPGRLAIHESTTKSYTQYIRDSFY